MIEEFVPFELAKKLKEKGFDEKCFAQWYPARAKIELSYNPKDMYLEAPTIAQAMKWLREEKQLFIEPALFKDGYEPYIQSTIFKEDKDYTDTWRVKGFHPTYEAAAIAGIEYVIDNLI